MVTGAHHALSEATKNKIIFVGMLFLIALNLFTFIRAYPEIFVVDSGCCSNHVLAKDFSAYYVGAWRLLHDTPNVYAPGGLSDGGPSIYPMPESFKYLPSFLLFVLPSLLLSYQSALVTFDILQILLLPAMAFMTYRLARNKGAAITLVIAAVVLLQPSPAPQWGLSLSYYWQWAEGQAKVLEAFLLILTFYLGARGMPRLSGAAFGLAAFDPRFVLISAPLFLVYNKHNLRWSTLSAVLVGLSSNFVLLAPGVASGLAAATLSSGLTTPVYYYSYIPILTVVCISILNAREIASLARRGLHLDDG